MGYGNWKNYSEGDSTIDDDFISQGFDTFQTLLYDLSLFVESGMQASEWLRATNTAERFVRDYADIPQGLFSAYNYWGRKWIVRQVVVNLYNTLVGDLKKFIDGKITGADILGKIRYYEWFADSGFILAPFIEEWMNSSKNTIGSVFSRYGSINNPKMTGTEYEDWLTNKYTYKGNVHFASSDVRDLMEGFRNMFESNIVTVPWPIVKFDAPVEIVRDKLTDEIVLKDVEPDVVVEGTGADLPDAFVVGFDGKVDYMATAKKYALPVGLAVLAFVALN
jgi:hypothetical protein